MKKHLSSTLALMAIAGGICYGSAACAQSVDYGSLESLFGEPITTSATGTPQRVSDVAINMTIITADEIRQSGSRSIPEILSRVPGLDILQEGINNWDVGVRGYQQPYNPRLLVLIDGREVFIDTYSFMSWNNLPVNIDDIRQIEVVKGASSALFGSNATGGVINIITYSPVYDKSNVATVGVGTQNELTGDATATASLGEFGGIKVSAGGLTESEFGTPRPQADAVGEIKTPYHRYVTQESVFKVNDSFAFNTHADFSDKSGDESSFTYALAPITAITYSVGGGFDWQSPYGLIKNTNYINHDHFEDVSDAFGNFDVGNTLVVSNLQDQFKLDEDNTFRAFVEYRYKTFKTEVTPSNSLEYPYLTEYVYAAGGTWLWKINDKLSMTNAVREDQNVMQMGGTLESSSVFPSSAYNQAYNTTAINSGLVYQATDMDTFRATYGRGVQNPSEVQTAYDNNIAVAPGFNVDLVGNPNLRPTIVDNYELDYDRKVPNIFSVVRFAAYYEFNHDLTSDEVLGFDAHGVEEEFVNVGNSQGWGGEIELKGSHPLGFRWDGSYSYQTIRDAALVAQTLGYANSSPEHHLRLLLGYTTGKWEFDANGQYVSSTDMLHSSGISAAVPTESPGYASVSGRIGYKVNDHVTVAASGVNINHQYLEASPYPEIEQQFMLTLTGKF
ncbi:MAG: TonB-dependent receptor [Alphaproteobacteria bacterium]